jgi:hypothetical protein
MKTQIDKLFSAGRQTIQTSDNKSKGDTKIETFNGDTWNTVYCMYKDLSKVSHNERMKALTSSANGVFIK